MWSEGYDLQIWRTTPRQIVIAAVCEDVLHWYILRHWVLSGLPNGARWMIGSILFALGHLGWQYPLVMARDRSFWYGKFPPMLFMGTLYQWVAIHYGIWQTVLHITLNLFLITAIQYVRGPPPPDIGLREAALLTKARRMRMTPQQREEEDAAYETQRRHFAEEMEIFFASKQEFS